jgi:hypothetical protein
VVLYTLVEVYGSFTVTYCIRGQKSAVIFNPEEEELFVFKALLSFCSTTRRHIPQDSVRRSHYPEYLEYQPIIATSVMETAETPAFGKSNKITFVKTLRAD